MCYQCSLNLKGLSNDDYIILYYIAFILNDYLHFSMNMYYFNVSKLRIPVAVAMKSLTCINVGLMPMSSQPMMRGRDMISRPALRPNLSNR